MSDLIDRQELKKRYITTAQSGGYLGDAMSIATNHLTRLLRLIDEAPAVEPIKGEWIESTEYDDEDIGLTVPIHYCSLCMHYKWFTSNFCPNCGADMRAGVSPAPTEGLSE